MQSMFAADSCRTKPNQAWIQFESLLLRRCDMPVAFKYQNIVSILSNFRATSVSATQGIEK
jgi:hypothetical protein